MSPATMRVGDRLIGAGAPVFVIAEAGVNHNGDLELARKLVAAAAAAGADAVKFQTFRTEALVARTAPKAAYQVETTGGGESQLEMLRKLELGPAAHATLRDESAKRGILFFSSPFDEASADALEALGVALFKVPSGEITNLPFLRHLAGKRRPLIVSTGMSTLDEVAEAVTAIREAGDPPRRVGAGRRGQAAAAVGGRHAPGRAEESGRRAGHPSGRAAHARPDRDQAAGHRHLAG